jgi:hypothetical protein
MAHILYVDDRERAVSEYLGLTNHKVERLARGDYAIVNTQMGRVVDIIERKTLDDYAASIKDGRIQNIEGLIEARAKTGCNIKLIIEGPAFPDGEHLFSGIPYKSIAASIMHMQVRYNIIVIYSKSAHDTAFRLEKLVETYNHVAHNGSYESHLPITLVFNPELKIHAMTTTGQYVEFKTLFDRVHETLAAQGHPLSHVVVQPNIYHENTIAGALDIIKVAAERKLEDDIRDTRMSISGVGKETFHATLGFSIAEILSDITCLERARLPNGNKLSQTAMRAFLNLQTDDLAPIKFLKEIPGISQTGAGFIMKSLNRDFTQLCRMSEAEIAAITYKKTAAGVQQRVGPALAKRIFNVLHFKVV